MPDSPEFTTDGFYIYRGAVHHFANVYGTAGLVGRDPVDQGERGGFEREHRRPGSPGLGCSQFSATLGDSLAAIDRPQGPTERTLA